MKKALFCLSLILASQATSAPAQVIQNDPPSQIVIRPIQYDDLLKQIERIKHALANIDLNADEPAADLIATVPDYAAAREELQTESKQVLNTYLQALEKLVADAQRLAQENSALAALYQGQIDALVRAASQASGEERTALNQAARQQARDSEKLIEQNTQKVLDQMAQTYANAIMNALAYKNIANTPRHTSKGAKLRNALTRLTFLAVNLGGNAAWAIPVFKNWDKVGEAIAWTTFVYGVFQVGLSAALAHAWEVEIDSVAAYFAYGLGATPAKAAENRWKARAEAAQAYVTDQSETLFADCQTAACVYRLSFDYQRFFKTLTELDENLQIDNRTIESPVQIKFQRVKSFLKAAAKMAAEKRPTAVFTPAGAR